MSVFHISRRETLIRYHTQKRECEYTFGVPFYFFIGTWNVNGQSPSSSLRDWLCSSRIPPDIYAIGFQELDLSTEALLFDTTSKEAEWFDAVKNCIDSRNDYAKICLVRLVGMMLIVFAKKEICNFIKNVDCDTVGTGIMGKMGNKGGVSIRFDLHDASICFVNCHLAAHAEECDRRNQDYQDIYSKIQFAQLNPSKQIKDHDQIYWMGDLNYRIAGMDQIRVKQCLKLNNIDFVLKSDQLRAQIAAHNILNGFVEGPIAFQPTYKYDPGTNAWDSSDKERIPAWCDRIFWKGQSIEQLSYQSHPEINISDHKPVSASFVSEIRVVDVEKYREVYRDAIKKMDKIENEYLPRATVDPTEITFDTVKYLKPQIREICIANTGQVPVKFQFIKKPNELLHCKEWLNIIPSYKEIYPGEKCDVKLKIFVNKKTAFKLNLGEDQLYDILVLHLDGGKDIFITVNAPYEKSCFGSSIESLIHLKSPICDINTKININPYLIPKEIWFLIDHISKQGLKKPNLFKQRGIHSELLLIFNWLDHGSKLEIPGSIHSAVEALLLFLESTPHPIIPFNLHDDCINASSSYPQCKQIIMQLPSYKINVFLYLCLFLQEVLNHSKDNGVDLKMLSNIFSDIFLRGTPKNKSKIETTKKKSLFLQNFLVNDILHWISLPF